jgi:hypothetical protein
MSFSFFNEVTVDGYWDSSVQKMSELATKLDQNQSAMNCKGGQIPPNTSLAVFSRVNKSCAVLDVMDPTMSDPSFGARR